MNLTTHWVLAVVLGVAIFHNIEIALIMSIGALIPDIDREYFFVAKNFIGRHRAPQVSLPQFHLYRGPLFDQPLSFIGGFEPFAFGYVYVGN